MEKLFAAKSLGHRWVGAEQVHSETRKERDKRWKENGWDRVGFHPESGIGGYFTEDVLQEVDGQVLVEDPYLSLTEFFRTEESYQNCGGGVFAEDQRAWLRSQIKRREREKNVAVSIAIDLIHALSFKAEQADQDAIEQLRTLGVLAAMALETAYQKSEVGKEALHVVAKNAKAWPVSMEYKRRPYGDKMVTRQAFLDFLKLGGRSLPAGMRTTRSVQSTSRKLAGDLVEFVSENCPDFAGETLNDSNKKVWWAECLRVFKRAYPLPEEVKVLEAICEKNKKSEAKLRAAIREAVRSSFMRLA